MQDYFMDYLYIPDMECTVYNNAQRNNFIKNLSVTQKCYIFVTTYMHTISTDYSLLCTIPAVSANNIDEKNQLNPQNQNTQL